MPSRESSPWTANHTLSGSAKDNSIAPAPAGASLNPPGSLTRKGGEPGIHFFEIMKTSNQIQALRLAAHALLEQADDLERKLAYVVIHTYRLGETAHILRYSQEPTEADILKSTALKYEPEKGEGIAVYRVFTHELCGLAEPDRTSYPLLPGRLPGLLDSLTNPCPSPAVKFTFTTNGDSQTLGILHQGDLSGDAFIAIQRALGVLYQQASGGNLAQGRVHVEAIADKAEGGSTCQ